MGKHPKEWLATITTVIYAKNDMVASEIAWELKDKIKDDKRFKDFRVERID